MIDPTEVLPVRAFWSWPLAFAWVGLVEASVHAARMGAGPGQMLLAGAHAAVCGLWLGVLFGLGASLCLRRFEGFAARMDWRPMAVDIALVVLGSLLVTVAGFLAVERLVVLFTAQAIDSPMAAIQIWRGLVALTVPVAVALMWWSMRWVRERTGRWRGWVWVARAGLIAWATLLTWHLAGGPFVAYFGMWAPLAAVAFSALAAASLLPVTVDATPKLGALFAGALVVLVVLGAWGSAHVGARALLLHDARLFPPLRSLCTGPLDRDGDGEIGSWALGTDCNDSDPQIARWRPELPGNGVDDNCREGDGQPRAESDPVGVNAGHARPPVFLITIDTVRADHLPTSGYERATMPGLSSWSTRATRYDFAWAPSNHTAFSMLSLLSGQSPEFLVREGEVLDAGAQKFTYWLPKEMADLGYQTVAVNPALVPTGVLSPEQLRFEEIMTGPWDFAAKNRGTQARQVIDWTLQFLARRDDKGETRPPFVWVHIGDPHARHEAHPVFPGQRPEDHYDDELAWVDANLVRLLVAIEQRYEGRAVVAVTSDHGEAFGERGAHGHGFSLYETMLRVPLLIRAPGLPKGVVERPVSVTAVAPTLLALIGHEPGPRPTAAPLTTQGADAEIVTAGAPFFWNEKRMEVAVTDGHHKAIWNRRADTWLLFDLDRDPRERKNLAPRQPERLASLQRSLWARLEQGR